MADNLMAHKFDRTKYDSRKSELTAAKAAVANLNSVITTIDAANLNQARAAIKLLARLQKRVIRVVIGEVA